MGKYIHKFDSAAELEAEYGKRNYLEPWVSYTEENEEVKYNISEEQSLLTPFTVNILTSGTITWDLEDKVVRYSKNEDDWQIMRSTTTIDVDEGDEIRFKGTNPNYKNNRFKCTGQFYVRGNIMSIIDEEDFANLKVVNEYAFKNLFDKNNTLLYADRLLLPATVLAEECYSYMFDECGNLTKVPKLPALILANRCYANMFSYCTKLKIGPELPATTLAESCYQGMFYYCQNLVKMPDLPATSLAFGCYSYMFFRCTSLVKTISELSATTLAPCCYWEMFEQSGIKIAPKLPATNLEPSCYWQMFRDCNYLIKAPELPATTMKDSCYYGMFMGCDFTEAPELPATILAKHCYQYMFDYCRNLVNAPNLPATTLEEGCYEGMFSDCDNLINVQQVLPATTLANSCYSEMFYNCNNITTAPELPALELVTNCYYRMFYSCDKLNYVKAMFLTTPSSEYTSGWLAGVVYRNGTFVANINATWELIGADGVPTNWTLQRETP